LYHHVSSKQEILLALLEQALDVLHQRISAVTQQELPADEKLRQMIRSYLSGVTEYRDLASVLLLEHRSLDPKLHTRHVPKRDRFEELWRAVVRDGMQTGIFDCPDPALTVQALMGMMNWTITWYKPKGRLSIEQIADEYASLLLDGILTESEQSK
jgi:AcrR family transcriptional regulator